MQKNKQKENVKSEELASPKNKGIFSVLLHVFYLLLFLSLFISVIYIYFFDLEDMKENISAKLNNDSFNLEREKIALEQAEFYSKEREKILLQLNGINIQLKDEIKKIKEDLKNIVLKKNNSDLVKETRNVGQKGINEEIKELRSEMLEKISMLSKTLKMLDGLYSKNEIKLKEIEKRLSELEQVNGKKASNFGSEDTSKILSLLKEFSNISYEVLEAEIKIQNNQKITDRIVNYFKSKFISRSITPIEGKSTDAILSRIENFLKEGQLSEARREIEKLTPEAKEVMSSWIRDFNQFIEK